jgi:hypothetical protein
MIGMFPKESLRGAGEKTRTLQNRKGAPPKPENLNSNVKVQF